MTDDGAGDGPDPAEDDLPSGVSRVDPERAPPRRPTLSADGAYALLWGVVALAAAALAFDGSPGAVVGFAGLAGTVGVHAAGRDLLRGRPPTGLVYLWMGTPALLGAGVAAFDGRLLAAGGLGVVAVTTLVEGYGWFGAGGDDRDDATGDERADESGERQG